jgi:diaminopimelate epimerase
MHLVKAQAFGNDFLLAVQADWPGDDATRDLARRVCARHTGVGADGVIFVRPTARGADTLLRNADGSPSEISGNGLRCVAAWLAVERDLSAGASLTIATGAGERAVTVTDRAGLRVTCRADMGTPTDVCRVALDTSEGTTACVTLGMGNPQCVVLGDGASLTAARLHTVAAELAVHPHFPAGTNVELATVDAPSRVRILIWERGVGPTEASGTGACAAAVAAMMYGGAAAEVEVVSPGGAQRVEWVDGRVWLTGWAELVAAVDWWAP